MPGNEVCHDEADQSIGVRLLLVLKVQSIMHLSNADRSFMRVVFQNQLLEVKECSFMVDALP